jgi:hypothetical protein
MDKKETLTTMDTQDTGRRQAKQINSTQHTKIKRMSNTNPTNVFCFIFRNNMH